MAWEQGCVDCSRGPQLLCGNCRGHVGSHLCEMGGGCPSELIRAFAVSVHAELYGNGMNLMHWAADSSAQQSNQILQIILESKPKSDFPRTPAVLPEVSSGQIAPEVLIFFRSCLVLEQ